MLHTHHSCESTVCSYCLYERQEWVGIPIRVIEAASIQLEAKRKYDEFAVLTSKLLLDQMDMIHSDCIVVIQPGGDEVRFRQISILRHRPCDDLIRGRPINVEGHKRFAVGRHPFLEPLRTFSIAEHYPAKRCGSLRSNRRKTIALEQEQPRFEPSSIESSL